MEVAIFKKNKSGRSLVGIWSGKTKENVINEVKRAGVLSSGSYVAFSVSKNKNAFRIDNIPVNNSGKPFTH